MDASCGQFQEIPNHSLENVLACTKTQQDRKPKPQPEQALPCPRCESTNTKFCYYNNYSLSQPRYFCKSCRRYWTKGGTLRNVPVGGGCRKNKRSSSSSYKRTQEQSFGNNPSNTLAGYQTLGGYDSNDLALAFARLQQKQCHGQQQLGYHEDHDMSIIRHQNNTQCDIIANHSNVHNGNSEFLDALRSGYLENQNDYHNLYSYGVGNGVNNIGDVDNSGSLEVSTEMVMPFQEEISTIATTTAVTVTTMKQEMCNVARESENRGVLWGFPWQFNGDGNMSDVAASSWHGLINSPLM